MLLALTMVEAAMWMHVWIGVDAAIAKSKKDVIATPTVLSASGGNVAKRMMGFSLSLSPGPYDRFASSLDRRRTDVERSAHVLYGGRGIRLYCRLPRHLRKTFTCSAHSPMALQLEYSGLLSGRGPSPGSLLQLGGRNGQRANDA